MLFRPFFLKRMKRWTRAGLYEFISECLAELKARDSVLVVGGSGPILNHVLQEFPELCVTTLDINPAHQPMIIGDLADSALANQFQERFDAVVLCEVLEHVPDYAPAIRNAFTMLRAGGVLVATTPWITPLHDKPHDYHRFSGYEIERILLKSGFSGISLECRGGFLDSLLALGLRGFMSGGSGGVLVAVACVFLTFFMPRPKRLTALQDSTIGYNFRAFRIGPTGA